MVALVCVCWWFTADGLCLLVACFCVWFVVWGFLLSVAVATVFWGLLGLVMHGLVVVVCGLFPSCFDLWVGVDYDLVSIAGCGFLSSSTLFLMGFGLIW